MDPNKLSEKVQKSLQIVVTEIIPQTLPKKVLGSIELLRNFGPFKIKCEL